MKNTDFNSNKIYSIDEINKAAKNNPEKLLLESDKRFGTDICEAVDKIIKRSDNGGVIMLSGPSSAGKTTTAMMIDLAIEQKGRPAVKISLDDFFLAADETPLDENGKRDFEGIAALNLDELRDCLTALAETGECDMPKYDFSLKRPADNRQHISLPRGGFVIIEGLHAINPLLTSKISQPNVTRVFLNVESGVSIDGKILNGRTLRMLRRIVRDTTYRSINAEQCIELWQSVIKGEKKNILPYVEYCDIVIDSFHKSELGVIGSRAIPKLQTVPESSEYYDEAQRLANLLSRVQQIDSRLISKNSLLTEFVGGGSYEY